MSMSERILRPVKRLRGGLTLDHSKHTADTETVIMPIPATVYIPLCQHIGAPCEPKVAAGDEVYVGTLIGDSEALVSAPVHSSVSGKVKSVKERLQNGIGVMAVEIESDGKQTVDPSLSSFNVENAEDIARAARLCGLVGLGGAGFPTHIKLTKNPATPLDTLIINAAECEPYLTSDYRECMESGEDIVEAVYLLKEKLGLERVIIAVESNKPAAIEKLFKIAADTRDTDDSVKLMRLPSSYPQGAEKVIIYSATGRVVPAGKLPSDVGCIVMNITSLGTLYRFIKTGMPLVSKRITVEGDAVLEPKNIIVPIGTPIREVLSFAGGIDEETASVFAGGPMMGNPITDLNSVIEKRNNGILAMKPQRPQKQTPCIRCGRCVATCPMGLTPAAVETAYKKGEQEKYAELHADICIECGSCTYICPAKRPLTAVMRIAKAEMRRNKK